MSNSSLKLSAHYQCLRAVNTARKHGCHFEHPWTRLVLTGRVGNPCYCRSPAGRKQVAKVIWHKAASPPHSDGSVVYAGGANCRLYPIYRTTKMVAMATSLRCSVSAISTFCWPTTQTPSTTNSLVVVVHTKPVIAILVPQLFAMAMSLSTCGLPSNTWFLGPIQAHNRNGISIGSAVFAEMTAECPYTLQWAATSPIKIAFSHGVSGRPSNTMVPCAYPCLEPK